MFPAILYGCETSYLTLGEEYVLQVFESKIFSKYLDLSWVIKGIIWDIS
jgi:hypothetical protein